jgi:hypothetical protein
VTPARYERLRWMKNRMKYTGTTIPARRKAPMPHAVAWRLPWRLACQKMSVDSSAATVTARRKSAGRGESMP